MRLRFFVGSVLVGFVSILPMQAGVSAQTTATQTSTSSLTTRPLSPQLLSRLAATKAKADPAKLAATYVVSGGRTKLRLANGKLVAMDPTNAVPALVPAPIRPTTTTPAAMTKYKPYWSVSSSAPLSEKPTLIQVAVDHTARQTAVKDQKGRGSCVAFAVAGAMESFLNWKTNVKHDISEEHMFKLFKDSTGGNCNDYGFTYTGAWTVLSEKRVCSEVNQPYVDPSQCSISTRCEGATSYKLKDVTIITNTEDPANPGWYASNPKVLESLLEAGFDVSIGAGVAGTGWSYDAATGIIDVQLDSSNAPLAANSSHAMNIVGYNRPGGYFIVKNSWGTDWGRDGYARFSYDYMQTYVNGALVVEDASYVMPMQAQDTTNVTATTKTAPIAPALKK